MKVSTEEGNVQTYNHDRRPTLEPIRRVELVDTRLKGTSSRTEGRFVPPEPHRPEKYPTESRNLHSQNDLFRL